MISHRISWPRPKCGKMERTHRMASWDVKPISQCWMVPWPFDFIWETWTSCLVQTPRKIPKVAAYISADLCVGQIQMFAWLNPRLVGEISEIHFFGCVDLNSSLVKSPFSPLKSPFAPSEILWNPSLVGQIPILCGSALRLGEQTDSPTSGTLGERGRRRPR